MDNVALSECGEASPHTCYDPELHARKQTAHGSWVLSFKPH